MDCLKTQELIIVVGQPERQVRQASHCGSKLFFFAETFRSFLAETFRSLKHFGDLLHTCNKTRPKKCFLANIFKHSDRNDLFFRSFQKRFGL